MPTKKDRVVVLLEDMRAKLDIPIEGHASLRQEIRERTATLQQEIQNSREALEQVIQGVATRLDQKIDSVAADLAAHRRDTETHTGGYRVGEST